MIVFNRRKGDSLVVPDCDLEVTIVAIKGDQVRLGITAPSTVAFYRKEIWLLLSQQKAVGVPNESAPKK
jgi:carbon storage regulator